MLFAFDLDGTLISSYMEREDKDYHNWTVLPNVKEKLQRLKKEHTILVITNQGGISLGYQDTTDWLVKSAEVAEVLNFQLHHDIEYYVCFEHDGYRRKPNPTMIYEALSDWVFDASDVLFVGDMESDREAAKRAGIGFMYAKDFFDWE